VAPEESYPPAELSRSELEHSSIVMKHE